MSFDGYRTGEYQWVAVDAFARKVMFGEPDGIHS